MKRDPCHLQKLFYSMLKASVNCTFHDKEQNQIKIRNTSIYHKSVGSNLLSGENLAIFTLNTISSKDAHSYHYYSILLFAFKPEALCKKEQTIAKARSQSKPMQTSCKIKYFLKKTYFQILQKFKEFCANITTDMKNL